MKKILLITAVCGLAMASCKKNYTCECVTKDGGTVISTTDITIKDTKSKAKDACSAKITSSGGGSTATMECSIK